MIPLVFEPGTFCLERIRDSVKPTMTTPREKAYKAFND